MRGGNKGLGGWERGEDRREEIRQGVGRDKGKGESEKKRVEGLLKGTRKVNRWG